MSVLAQEGTAAAPEKGDGNGVDRNLSQVVSFRLANEEYGLDIMGVQEIILLGEITEIPEVPDYICGIINLRGKVIPIVDLRKRFGLTAAKSNEHTRIIVLNANDTTYGIIVDAVSHVLRIDANSTEPPPPGLVGMEKAYIVGLVKREDRILILLNAAAILSAEDHATIPASATMTA